MKLVIDCNVFVSASLDGKTCGATLEVALLQHHVYYSRSILGELQSTLARPKFCHPTVQDKSRHALNLLQLKGYLIEPPVCPFPMPDPKDEMYLATALAAQADAIITGNQKHFPPLLCGPVRILSPRQFLTETCPDLSV